MWGGVLERTETRRLYGKDDVVVTRAQKRHSLNLDTLQDYHALPGHKTQKQNAKVNSYNSHTLYRLSYSGRLRNDSARQARTADLVVC